MSTYNEIYVTRDNTEDLFNSLTNEEKIFVYYIFRSALPFNRINRNQNHRYSNQIIELFEQIYHNLQVNDQNLIKDIETYLVYLWSNHGIYFLMEHTNNNKRTP